MFEFIKKKNNMRVFFLCSVVMLIVTIPFSVNLLYSIDDYYNYMVYDLNWKNFFYNFFTYGRFMEGNFAELFYRLNLSPITKPIGVIVFIISNAFLSVYIMERFDIKDFYLKCLFSIIFMSNPFYIEIYYYSTITIYSGLAIFFLTLGLIAGEQYQKTKVIKWMIISMINYFISLSIYQVFYVIILVLLLYEIVIAICSNRKITAKLIQMGIAVGSIGIYYILLMVIFKIFSSLFNIEMHPSGDLGNMLKQILSKEFWITLQFNLEYSFLTNNAFSSSLLNKGIIVLSIILILFAVIIFLYHREWKRAAVCAICYLFYSSVCIFACIGFALISIYLTSSRYFTAYSIVLITVGLLFGYELLKEYINEKILKYGMLFILLIIGFSNTSRIGRAAIDLERLNNLEANLANRIVARMESFEEFSPDAKVYIVGRPNYHSLNRTNYYCYNEPALAAFSKIFVLNEISGYNFISPSEEDINKASLFLEEMEEWPAKNSCIYVENNMFIIKLSK